MTKPSVLLITIDTEGDDAWSGRQPVTTRNARFLPRFQNLCERYGLTPTYLVNHEMAMDPFFVDFGRDLIQRGTAEIGMHLHAWHSPPHWPLPGGAPDRHPYLIDYPDSVMEDKIAHLTALLEERFAVKMRSHRAGRWALDRRYARLLVKYGYGVDCSVTPGLSWPDSTGAAGRPGGADYRRFPDRAYLVDLDDISRPGDSPLLELPMTIGRSRLHRLFPQGYAWPGLGRVLHRLTPPHRWLRLLGNNLPSVLRLVSHAARQSMPYLELMQHSSEFMPGGSPYFQDSQAVERLYDGLELVFERATKSFTGETLSGYRGRFLATSTTTH